MDILDFIWHRANQVSNKKKISFTINLSLDENEFAGLEDFYKISINDIAKKYGFDIYTDERIKKFECLIKEIKYSEGNILVANAGYNVGDFNIINSLLTKENLQIHTVFIRSEKRRNADLKEGQELYNNLNRWIDFYPGQIEDVHQKREDNLKEIIDYFQSTKTLIEEV
ncbi:hypothetical protein [Flavobacterium sp. KJJ]|uniref:hypothetical protein n=1 Tax=Flavobacterium sp. KJJ TaxID=1270193 RepID=UPI000492FCD7|nr:hypothetical protein [Flavobacterium sp. KJJ]